MPEPPAPGESVTAGVRPEALGRARTATPGSASRVEHVEQLGHETLTYVRVHGADDVRSGRAAPRRLSGEKGEQLDLVPDPDRVYVSAADGRTLDRLRAPPARRKRLGRDGAGDRGPDRSLSAVPAPPAGGHSMGATTTGLARSAIAMMTKTTETTTSR